MSAKRIPITAAKRIAQDYGYDQVVIIARKVGPDGKQWMTTYGRDKAHCKVASLMGSKLAQFMGWKMS